MQYDTIPSNGTISHRLSYINGQDIRVLYQVGSEGLGISLRGTTGFTGINGYLKNLKAKALISSLAEINIPTFALDEDDSTRLAKTLDLQWTSQRIHLELWIAKQGKDWENVGTIPLQNPQGYPYREYDLLDLYTDSVALELEQGAKIGASVRDVGWGALQGGDEVIFYGSWQEEIIFINDTIQQQEEALNEKVTEQIEANQFLNAQTLTSQPITIWDVKKGHFATFTPLTSVTLTATNLVPGTYVLMLPPGDYKSSITWDSSVFSFVEPINTDYTTLDIFSFASDGSKLYGLQNGGWT